MIWTVDADILAPPLAAGLLIVLTHAVLGREVIRRGIIFIDITLAQVAALGVIIAASLHFEQGWQQQAAAATAALVAGGVLSWTEARWRERQEALIGSVYVVAASVAMLLLADDPHGTEELSHLLAGQILWVSVSQLGPVALLYAVLLALWFGFARARQALFYPVFALTITASVQLAGVYLVFATLVLPALASASREGWRGLMLAWSIGALAYALGLWLSIPTDLPSGPLVVCALAGLALLSAAKSPRRRQIPLPPFDKGG